MAIFGRTPRQLGQRAELAGESRNEIGPPRPPKRKKMNLALKQELLFMDSWR